MTDNPTHPVSHNAPQGAPAACGNAPATGTPAPTDAPASIPGHGEEIELRSEKAPRSIGAIPRNLTVWSLAVTLLFFAAIILAVSLIPYPYSHGESILQHLLGQ
ncbi:MAG: hypothetical protein K2O78_07430 [Muribaculaceae bacterium]|nr:hypothetical protein [Muribaculaceae bacterium]